MGDTINVLIDDLWAFLNRIFYLPLSFQLLIYISANLLLWLVSFSFLRLIKRPLDLSMKRWIFVSSVIVSTVVGFLVVYDFRQFQAESNEKFMPAKIVTIGKGADSTFNNLVSNPTKTPAGQLNQTTSYIYNSDGIEIVQYQSKEPLAVAYIAAIDLEKYEVVLDTGISVKELTSKFSKRFNVDIAVNGEAGTTPGETAPLGQWIGTYVVDGKVILNKDNRNRPFIYFDKNMNGYYSHEDEVIKSFPEKIYNAIWGRFDLIRDGQLAISPRDGTQGNPYPRTIVGIDKSGRKAFLMIVDGRKPTHSLGMTMKECGEYLLKVGCYQAMACDQGGSSVMYSKELGIFTRPADGGERKTYSHLGFRKKTE